MNQFFEEIIDIDIMKYQCELHRRQILIQKAFGS